MERIETDTNFGAEIDQEAPLSESNKDFLQGAVRELPLAKALHRFPAHWQDGYVCVGKSIAGDGDSVPCCFSMALSRSAMALARAMKSASLTASRLEAVVLAIVR
ncbi:hypothetical protein BKK80_12065 [Cupriavidus malaysiensis]|uniref:Uncharacterized protein n=1 Tax=Cupriavidus malaysiensis TaxID=367825 RepID=A0ABM6F4T0_9BURK|nr:hypothetical protein BKK80_12065 [Cupriavidus malaysiensis]